MANLNLQLKTLKSKNNTNKLPDSGSHRKAIPVFNGVKMTVFVKGVWWFEQSTKG